MSRSYFISDLHLSEERPRVTEALAAFLYRSRDCNTLYILGDLFDAWVGDDDDSHLALHVKGLLKDFSTAGPSLFIMQGNRDFLLGDQFCAEVGARLLPDPSVVQIAGQPTLLTHGDCLCTDDIDYQAFRKTVRNPSWQLDILARSLEERRALARELRGMSGDLKSNKPEDIMDASQRAIDQLMDEHGVQQIIHGHTHRPGTHLEQDGTRWVLGEWGREAWAAECSGEGINLIKWFI